MQSLSSQCYDQAVAHSHLPGSLHVRRAALYVRITAASDTSDSNMIWIRAFAGEGYMIIRDTPFDSYCISHSGDLAVDIDPSKMV